MRCESVQGCRVHKKGVGYGVKARSDNSETQR